MCKDTKNYSNHTTKNISFYASAPLSLLSTLSLPAARITHKKQKLSILIENQDITFLSKNIFSPMP